jgi:hypothetical protein
MTRPTLSRLAEAALMLIAAGCLWMAFVELPRGW